MADAKKCDRCGSYYDRIARPDSDYLLTKYTKDASKLIDLCPECTKLLNLWMEGKAEIIGIDVYADWETKHMNIPREDKNGSV